MKNKHIKFLLILLSISLSLSCKSLGGGESNANQTVKSNNSNSGATPIQSDKDKQLAEMQEGTNIQMPSPNPVEKGKKQSYTGITIDVPADWKALKKMDNGTSSSVGFQSPGSETDAVKVFIERAYEMQQGDMPTHFIKLLKEKIYTKIDMRGINDATGILYLSENPDYLLWQTFIPPDAKGYTVKRGIKFLFPNGTFEQNKQQIADILFSAKIEY
ncbi:hypothetical protein BH20ACI4_BH20ACI4_25520 [soil metagenome]